MKITRFSNYIASMFGHHKQHAAEKGIAPGMVGLPPLTAAEVWEADRRAGRIKTECRNAKFELDAAERNYKGALEWISKEPTEPSQEAVKDNPALLHLYQLQVKAKKAAPEKLPELEKAYTEAKKRWDLADAEWKKWKEETKARNNGAL